MSNTYVNRRNHAKRAIGKRQWKIGNDSTSPLPRGGSDLIPLMVFLLLGCFIGFACSRSPQFDASKKPSANSHDTLPLREILANQPDFVADEVFSQFEPRVHGGFSLGNKLAKKGDCYRSESEGDVLFFRQRKSTVYFNPRKKIFREVPSEDATWYQTANHVQLVVKEQNLKFEEIGTEMVDGHECRKIKVSRTTNVPNDPNVLFYAAKDLRNLVILVEVGLSDRTNRYFLRNISFEVPADLFAPIERYKESG